MEMSFGHCSLMLLGVGHEELHLFGQSTPEVLSNLRTNTVPYGLVISY